VAALERGLAQRLSAVGYCVLGKHDAAGEPDTTLLQEIVRLIENKLRSEEAAE